jgi:hypothetical protein
MVLREVKDWHTKCGYFMNEYWMIKGHMDTELIKAITEFLFVCDQPETVDLAFMMGIPIDTGLFPALDLFHTGIVKKFLLHG